jgi:hypothetical protein
MRRFPRGSVTALADNEDLRMTERKSPGKRRAKTPALFLNPLFDEKPSPAKLAVWTGHLHEKDFSTVDTARLRALTSLPSLKLFEDRAERIRRKIASWNRDKLEAYYVRTLLSALLLRNSQRMLGEMLPVLNALAERQEGHEELRKTARMLVLYANMLLKPELTNHHGHKRGGDTTAEQKRTEAQHRHDQWLLDFEKRAAGGSDARYIAGTLAKKHSVTPRAIREGIKEARERTVQERSK